MVLSGSKLPAVDVAWMRATGVDAAILSAHRRGVRILAVCGGAQILGEVVEDPHGVEGGGETRGLGLLPATTSLGPTKRVGRPSCQFRADLPAPWADLSGLCVEGYEVHFGADARPAASGPGVHRRVGLSAGRFHPGRVSARIPEDPKVLMALVGRELPRPLPQALDGWPTWSTGTWTWTRCCT